VIKAILFDLDNTLLDNDIDTFISTYVAAMSEHVSVVVPGDFFISHMLRATEAMVANVDPHRTNQEVFDAAFFPAIGHSRQELEPILDDFYANRFPEIKSLTQPMPEARALVEWAFDQGLQVVVATNPLFPRTAIEQRLAWAQVPVDAFAYDLVTSYETMHAAKPNPAYYLEIARRLDRQPEECLMVGDEWERDIAPALSIGMEAYWIVDLAREIPSLQSSPTGQGSLADFSQWVQQRVSQE
jgi:HAD superfamily hydrolase (TIGR01549 family)